MGTHLRPYGGGTVANDCVCGCSGLAFLRCMFCALKKYKTDCQYYLQAQKYITEVPSASLRPEVAIHSIIAYAGIPVLLLVCLTVGFSAGFQCVAGVVHLVLQARSEKREKDNKDRKLRRHKQHLYRKQAKKTRRALKRVLYGWLFNLVYNCPWTYYFLTVACQVSEFKKGSPL